MKKVLLSFSKVMGMVASVAYLIISNTVSAAGVVATTIYPSYDAFLIPAWTYQWSTTREGNNVTFLDGISSRPDFRLSDWYDGLTIHRYHSEFDTSAIGPTKEIVSAKLRLYFDPIYPGNLSSSNGWVVVPSDVTGSTPDQKWDSYTSAINTSFSSQTNISSVGYTDFELNQEGLEAINKTGVTKLGLVSYWDSVNLDPNQAYGPYKNDSGTLYMRNNPGVSLDPMLVIETVPVEVNEYPLYTQIESLYPSIVETSDWADDSMPCGTIATCGCTISSLVSGANYFGLDTDILGQSPTPATINSYLKSANGYYGGGILNWLAASAYFGELAPDGTISTRLQYPPEFIKSNVSSGMRASLDSGNKIVLAFDVTNPTNEDEGHFVWTPAYEGASFVVKDPLWYETSTSDDTAVPYLVRDYNNAFEEARVYTVLDEAEPLSGTDIEVVIQGTAELLYRSLSGDKVGYEDGNIIVSLDRAEYGNVSVVPGANIIDGKTLLIHNAGDEFTIEVIGTGTGGFEMEFFTISETGEVTTYTFSGQTIPGVISTFTFNLETGEVKEEPISYEQFLNILSLQLDGYTDQQKAFFMKWAEKMYSDMEEKTVSQALQSISVYGKLLVAKKVESPVLTSLLDLLTEGVKNK
jgi:hypothetical protein